MIALAVSVKGCDGVWLNTCQSYLKLTLDSA